MNIIIKNDGPKIKSTNYYLTPLGEIKFFLSLNGGAARILVPTKHKKIFFEELKKAEEIVLIYWKQETIMSLVALNSEGSIDNIYLF